MHSCYLQSGLDGLPSYGSHLKRDEHDCLFPVLSRPRPLKLRLRSGSSRSTPSILTDNNRPGADALRLT